MAITWTTRATSRLLGGLLLILLGVRAEAADPPTGNLEEVGRLAPVEVAISEDIGQHGFTLDLVAHEPIVNDPVDGCFDEHGNLYIAEMRGYPLLRRAQAAATAAADGAQGCLQGPAASRCEPRRDL